MNSDKIRLLALPTAQNACIGFIHGNIWYIPHIQTVNITSHVTQLMLHTGWLSITSCQQLKLAVLAYTVLAKKHLSYLANHLQLILIQL